jgi:hypothetical protein
MAMELAKMTERLLAIKGRVPFGYMRDGDYFVPSPAEQKAIRDMEAMRDTGSTIEEISRALAMRGLRLTSTGVALVLFEHQRRRATGRVKTSAPVVQRETA